MLEFEGKHTTDKDETSMHSRQSKVKIWSWTHNR